MGECCSKEDAAKDSARPSIGNRNTVSEFLDIRQSSALRYDEEIAAMLKREFENTPEIFLLNNLLMMVQFFEDFKRDMSSTVHNKVEIDLNNKLSQNENMGCIYPDTIFDLVNKNIKYRPLHGPQKLKSEPLLPIRMFVINDRIEVVNSFEVPEYTSIDKPAYQVRMEDSTNKGFVKLKLIENTRNPLYAAPNLNEPGPSGLGQRGIETSDMDDENYQYTTITYIKTPKVIKPVGSNEKCDTLPRSCLISKKLLKTEFEIRDMMVNNDNGQEYEEKDFFKTVNYVDAKEFMTFFKNNLFPNSAGRSLGFDKHEIEFTKTIPGKLFCNLTDAEDNALPREVIPAVSIDWPFDQTAEFSVREDRSTITDKNTGVQYKWPTDDMIKEIKSMSCVIVPKGYWKKKGAADDANLEWEIAFPKVERYLESRMTNAQIRCYILLILIHKVFIEPKTQQYGVLVEHIRCHMYWECEKNYRDWPEHRLGKKLLLILESFNHRLARSELPDFFIKDKNHFRNIPKKYLQQAQKIFHDIIQSPLVYFIKALRYIKYTSESFYSTFEFKEFYRKLIENQESKFVNPSLLAVPPNIKKTVYSDPETQYRHIIEISRKKKILSKNEKKKKDNKEDDKESVDSIDLLVTLDTNFGPFKTNTLLTLFIRSFINIAKDMIRHGVTENAIRIYLKQALYLNKIFESLGSGYIIVVRDLKNEIEQLLIAIQRSAARKISNFPPDTPVRNSIQFDFTQQILNNTLNLNNLHAAYNGVPYKVPPAPPTFKIRTPVAKVKLEHKGTSLTTTRSFTGRKSVSFVDSK